MHPYRLTHYGADALEDKESSALPGTRNARTFEAGGRLSQVFLDGGLDTQAGTKRAGFKTGALPMASPFSKKNTPGLFGPKATPKAAPKADPKATSPKFAPSTKPLGPPKPLQKPSQRLFAVPQKPSQKPQTAPKGGTGKPQTAYLAETARLIGMSFAFNGVEYAVGSVAVNGLLYPTVTATPYTFSGDTRQVGTSVLYDPTSADWTAVAYNTLRAFKLYNDDIRARNATASTLSADTTTGGSANVAVPVVTTPAPADILSTPSSDGSTPTTTSSGGSGTMRVTEDTSTSDYTPASEGFVLPTSDAEVISMSATALASEAQAITDDALMEGDMLPAEVTTVSLSEAEPTPQGGFLSKYKWWLAAGGVAAAGYVLLHRSNPGTYPLPAALSKLVR